MYPQVTVGKPAVKELNGLNFFLLLKDIRHSKLEACGYHQVKRQSQSRKCYNQISYDHTDFSVITSKAGMPLFNT